MASDSPIQSQTYSQTPTTNQPPVKNTTPINITDILFKILAVLILLLGLYHTWMGVTLVLGFDPLIKGPTSLLNGASTIVASAGLFLMRKWSVYLLTIIFAFYIISRLWFQIPLVSSLGISDPRVTEYLIPDLIGIGIRILLLLYLWISVKKLH